jgi:hypothetical protein
MDGVANPVQQIRFNVMDGVANPVQQIRFNVMDGVANPVQQSSMFRSFRSADFPKQLNPYGIKLLNLIA